MWFVNSPSNALLAPLIKDQLIFVLPYCTYSWSLGLWGRPIFSQRIRVIIFYKKYICITRPLMRGRVYGELGEGGRVTNERP